MCFPSTTCLLVVDPIVFGIGDFLHVADKLGGGRDRTAQRGQGAETAGVLVKDLVEVAESAFRGVARTARFREEIVDEEEGVNVRGKENGAGMDLLLQYGENIVTWNLRNMWANLVDLQS